MKRALQIRPEFKFLLTSYHFSDSISICKRERYINTCPTLMVFGTASILSQSNSRICNTKPLFFATFLTNDTVQ